MEYLPTWIPRIELHGSVYEHYPILELSRAEADRMLKHPDHSCKVLLRSSKNARQMNPETYYVATYFVPHRNESVNVIVTRAEHEAHGGKLAPFLLFLPPLLNREEDYSLLIQRNHPFYMDTQIRRHNSDVKLEKVQTTTEE
jgi:hypothetical protein